MNELNSYPTCHDDILEYEIVFFLCSLRYEECATTQHQVALQAEFEMLHELVEHNHCKTIKKAESYTRVEDIIAKSKTVQEFSDKISGNSKLNYAIGDDYFEFASSKDFDSANIAKQKFVDNWGEYLVCRHKKFLLSL